MDVFACSCLNLRVHPRGATPTLKDAGYPHKTPDDPFFSPDAYVVTLDLGGVTKSQLSFCEDRYIDGWTVTNCICCDYELCAQHVDDHDRVVVNSAAQRNPERIAQLMESSRYSKLFKLVLPDINDNFIQNNIDRNSSLDGLIEQVQNKVTNYLKDEHTAMEDRIRKFSASEQSAYANLLQKLRKHKQTMIYLLLKAKENKTMNQIESSGESLLVSPTAVNSKETANESSTSTDSAYDRSEASIHSHAKKPNARSLRRTVSNPSHSVKPKRGPRRPPASIDVGGVFDMEEFDSKEEYSDIDSEGSESSNVDDSVPENTKDRMICGTSLPMSIPAFSRNPHFSVMEDDEEDCKVPYPKNEEEIAASMRALACRVHDGTEMFGELPRRRLNTGELLSTRPF